MEHTTPEAADAPAAGEFETAEEFRARDVADLPEEGEDPDERYVHPGKEYDVVGGGSFEIIGLLESGPAGGIVLIESTDGSALSHEYESDVGGVSREALAEYIPEENDRAVWTVAGMLAAIRDLRIGEVDPYSYGDLRYDALDRQDA